MDSTHLISEIRKTPLLERLLHCQHIIGDLSHSNRALTMSIPPQPADEDVLFNQTLQDAIEAAKELSRIEEALTAARIYSTRDWGIV
jgi:hypothetical protein